MTQAQKDQKKNPAEHKNKSHKSVFSTLLIAAFFVCLHIFPDFGIPGPLLYVEKEGVIKTMGADNFKKMAFYLAPSAYSSICAEKNKNFINEEIISAVKLFNKRHYKDEANFISGLELNDAAKNTLDQYFLIYFKGFIFDNHNICENLTVEITKETFPY